MPTCWIGDCMQHSYLPLKGQINALNHCIMFGQIERNQQASSTMLPYTPSATPVATEVAYTQTVILLPFTHQSPLTQSDLHTLAIVSTSMQQGSGPPVAHREKIYVDGLLCMGFPEFYLPISIRGNHSIPKVADPATVAPSLSHSGSLQTDQ